MNDKELLELAAKAAGIEIEWTAPYATIGDFARVPDWNPLTDDGDALRLAVKLRLDLEVWEYHQDGWVVVTGNDTVKELLNPDPYAATRRAIVRAAAEIGRGME